MGQLHDAADRGDLNDAADDYGETVLVRAAGVGNIDVVRALLAAGADPSQPGELGHLPLEEAEQRGHVEAAKLLRWALEAKAEQRRL
jgi:uncharacterized protein